MHRHIYLTPREVEALKVIAREFGVNERDALKFALAAIIATLNENLRKETNGTSRNPG